MEIFAYIVMLAGLAVAIINRLRKKISLIEASFIVLACIGVGVFIGWGDEITTFTIGKEGITLEKEAKRIADIAGQTPLDTLPEEVKGKAKQTAPEILSYEREGKPLTADMHFVLGLDAANKGDMEETARRFGVSALLEKNSAAYNNWGFALSVLAGMKGDEALFQEAFEKCAKAIDIEPDYHLAYDSWGTALTGLAKLKGDETLFQQAFEKYAEAVRIKPDYHVAYYNWGAALSGLAGMKGDEKEKEALLRESLEKYTEAVRIEPDFYETYINWGAAFYELAVMKGDETLFGKAFTKYEKAININPDKYEAYNNWAVALRDCAKIVKDEAERDALLKLAKEKLRKAKEIYQRKKS